VAGQSTRHVSPGSPPWPSRPCWSRPPRSQLAPQLPDHGLARV